MSVDLKLVTEFAAAVHARAETVDPGNELDWYALTVGWALGKGLSPDQAHEFATHVRYKTPYG